MDDVNGYYSCSVNPSYISTWYTPFTRKCKLKGYEYTDNNISGNYSTDVIPNEEPNGWEDYQTTPIPEKIPSNFKDNHHNGVISITANSKIRKSLDYMIFLAKEKTNSVSLKGKDLKFCLNFVTVTLASQQIHNDSKIKSDIFQPFLNSLRQKFGVISYLWRAEKQGNDNIHFHIVTDKFIHWSALRNCWNKHQNKLGYVDRYRLNMQDYFKNGYKVRKDLLTKWTAEAQEKAYKEGKKCNWSNPNSTDIHGLRFVQNVKAYFVKYLTKSMEQYKETDGKKNQYSDLDGRLWASSSNLTKLKGARCDLDSQISEELNIIANNPKFTTIKSDFFSVTYCKITDLRSLGLILIPDLFDKYILSQFPLYFENTN